MRPFNAPQAVAVCVASFVAFFAMGAAIGKYLYDRLVGV